MINDDTHFMKLALKEAERAFEEDEVPIGAVIIHNGIIIGKSHNQRETLKDPTAHAEMLALTQASAALDGWRLEDTTIYVTLEPCAMCAGAIVLARVPRLVFGAFDPKAGACGSVMNIIDHPRLNHLVEVTSGILTDECGQILEEFFRKKRKKESM